MAFDATVGKIGKAICRATGLCCGVLPRLAKFAAVLRLISHNFLTPDHLSNGPLSSGKAGTVHGGDRLPWVRYADTQEQYRMHRSHFNFSPALRVCFAISLAASAILFPDRASFESPCDLNDALSGINPV